MAAGDSSGDAENGVGIRIVRDPKAVPVGNGGQRFSLEFDARVPRYLIDQQKTVIDRSTRRNKTS